MLITGHESEDDLRETMHHLSATSHKADLAHNVLLVSACHRDINQIIDELERRSIEVLAAVPTFDKPLAG